MQFRVVKAKVKGGFRQYSQIVESFRRHCDGMPTHRVIGSLGQVTDDQAALFKAACHAARCGAGVQVLESGVLDAFNPVAEWSRHANGLAMPPCPNWLGIDPARFHNTRLHRVLQRNNRRLRAICHVQYRIYC